MTVMLMFVSELDDSYVNVCVPELDDSYVNVCV